MYLPRQTPRVFLGQEPVSTYPLYRVSHSWPIQPSYELRLAKYAARGFPVAVPGLRMQELDLRAAVEARIVQLKGLARLLHIHLAVSN